MERLSHDNQDPSLLDVDLIEDAAPQTAEALRIFNRNEMLSAGWKERPRMSVFEEGGGGKSISVSCVVESGNWYLYKDESE